MADRSTWKRRVAEWRASKLTAAQFALGRGYAPTTLTWWAWKLGGESLARAEASPSGGLLAPERASGNGGQVRFLRLMPAATVEKQIAGPAAESAVTIQHGELRVHVRRGFEPSVLAAVLAVLDSHVGVGGRS
jgi:hypothetical protein